LVVDQHGRGSVETLRTGNQFDYVTSISSFVQFGGADMMMGISDEMSFLSIKVSSGAELDNQVSSEDKTVSQYVEKEISEVAEGPLSFINLVTGFVIYGILRIRRDEITLSNN
jgi:hypothetical protein